MYSKCHIRIGTLLCYILSLSTLCCGYVITTPRRWTVGEESQVCIILSAPAASEEMITFEMIEKTYDYFFNPFYYDGDYEEEEEAVVLIVQTSIIVPEGTQNICQDITLPETEVSQAEFTISGILEGQNISYTKSVAISSEIVQTFVQTDKYLYKPNQIVQFRILTVIGAFLQVSVEPYEEIWIENPSGIRLAQWLDVANDNGLVHLSFQLADEPEEGKYTIKVQTSFGKLYIRAFKVEEYVLPRFEVTINPPDYVLGSTEIITFEVCATYTFGQPVSGNVSITVESNDWGDSKFNVTKEDEIYKCASFDINAEELSTNGENTVISYYGSNYTFYADYLTAKAAVTEEGTGVKLEANEVSVDIYRTALRFKDISIEKYYKPELPYVGEIKVTFPDGSPTPNEPMTVCCEEMCKNMSTDADGILKFGIPPHLDCDIRIFAPGYPRIPTNDSWTNIMNKSGFRKKIMKYYSPSNSSLIISLSNEELECNSTTESIDFELPVMFAVNQTESALVTVQVVSRGKIQYSETFNITFTASSIPSIPESLFIAPIEEYSNTDLAIGYFTVSISIPKTVSPEAQILIWYARDDGEVVADAREVSIIECLLNSVNLSFSADKVLPGASASVSVTAEPLSLCSLGIVDKSVKLLTPKKYTLTIARLLKLTQKASVQEYDYKQADNYQYCNEEHYDGYDEIDGYDGLGGYDGLLSGFNGYDGLGATTFSRKKREALPLKFPSENLRRSKRSNTGPWYSYSSDDVDAIYMFDDAGVYVLSDLTLETRPCESNDYSYWDYYYYYYNNYNYDYYYNYYYYAEYPEYSGGGLSGGLIGGEEEEVVEEEEEEEVVEEEEETDDVRTYFPETWLWTLFNVSIDGLYVEDLTLPDTVTKWVGGAVCVHPSQGIGISSIASIITFKEFFVDLTLPPSVKRGEIFPVKISIFNYLNESLPIILILESPDGKFDILADSGENVGSGMRTICVPAQNKTVISIRIRAKEVGDVNISVQATVQENAVEDCGSGNVQQKSDYLIKPIRVIFEGFLKEEIQSVYLCTNGSGNVSETWNITVPESIVPDSARGFVAVIGDLMGPTLENLGNLVQMPWGCGEQNMVNFAPNIFVLQYLEATNQITADIANEAIEFMEYGYQKELNYRHNDGSFSAFGDYDESGSTWLTAFVLKCFAQASPYITIDLNDLNITREWLKSKQLEDGCFESVGQVFNKAMQGGVESDSPSLLTAYVLIALIEAEESLNSTAVSRALSCIDGANSTTNPYSLAIKAYALALANSPDTQATLDKLLELATTSAGLMYWEIPDEYESSEGVAVETASYTVLAILTFAQSSIDSFQQALPIIKWVNSKRNSQGGFISTQDTVITLQALAAFQKIILDTQGPSNLTVSLTMSNITESFIVNEENKLLQQSVPIPEVPTTITFNIDGQGCVLLQAILRYNVPESETNEAFSLRVTTTTEPDDPCKTKHIEVCASYLLPGEKSNMAIIEIDLVSGYIPVRTDLDELIGNGTGLFKRYEIDGSTIIIYVKEFSFEEICLSFRILREVDIENPKPGILLVYDYYKPEYQVGEIYTLLPLNNCVVEGEIFEGASTSTATEEQPVETTTTRFKCKITTLVEGTTTSTVAEALEEQPVETTTSHDNMTTTSGGGLLQLVTHIIKALLL